MISTSSGISTAAKQLREKRQLRTSALNFIGQPLLKCGFGRIIALSVNDREVASIFYKDLG
jgi:hypothetical protein